MLINALKRFTLSTFIRSVTKVAGGNLAISLISLVTSIFVARWSNPADLGRWNLVLLLGVYSPALQLGVFNGLNRQLPYYTGKGDQQTVDALAASAYSWCVVLTVFSVLATVAIAGGFLLFGRQLHAVTALAIGCVIACSWPTQYLTVTYRTSTEFGRLAGKNTIVAIASIPLIWLVLLYGYVGLMLRAVLSALLGIVALYIKRPVRVGPKWNGGLLMQLGKIGMPIWMLGQLGAMFLTLDRLMLADSPTTLGYFSIAVQASAFASMVPVAITMVLYPQMVQSYGASHLAGASWIIARKGALMAFGLGLVAAVCGWLIVPYFIAGLLPAYLPGSHAAQWACLTGISLALSVFNNVFNVIQRQDIYLASLVVGVFAFFAAWYALVRMMGQAPILAAVQSMLLANLMMGIAAAIFSKVVSDRHDARMTALEPAGAL